MNNLPHIIFDSLILPLPLAPVCIIINMSHQPAYHLLGTDNTAAFDPHFTQNVIKAIGPKASPRIREVMSSLIQHLHDFARENKITVEEWMSGVELINWAGKMSDDKRNEGQLVCDVLGLES